MVFMLAIVAFCVVCLIHREKSAFVVGDQLRHGSPCAFWWDPVLLSDSITGPASLQHNPAFFCSQYSRRQAGLLFLLTGREKIKHKQIPGPETKQKRRLNSADLQLTQPRHKARKQRRGKKERQIHSLCDQEIQVCSRLQQIFRISGVRLHYGFKVLFKMTFNPRVTTCLSFL